MYVASTFKRGVAHLVDEGLSSLFFVPVLVAIGVQWGKGHGILIPWFLLGVVWMGRITYEVICIYVLQALPAQYFYGMRIVSTHHPELGLSLPQVLIRVLVGQLKYLFGPSIYFLALLHKQRQHLGDILAETRVVQFAERTFEVRPRYVLGSLLIYSSLVINLGESIDFYHQTQFTKAGVEPLFLSRSI